jgi:membrane protein required for colicin V production
MTMNWLDMLIVVIVALAASSSMNTGFVRQALALVGLITGVYVALTHHATAASLLGDLIPNLALASVIAFVLLLIAIWVAFAVLAGFAHRALKASGLAWADHLVGMLAGLLAGLFFSVCMLLLFMRVPVPAIHAAVQQSMLASLIFQMLPHLRQLVPVDLGILNVL